MFNKFSNEATSVIFETLANDPDAFERLQTVAKTAPARAVDEIRTFTEKRTVERLRGPNRDIVSATLRTVRWTEIREALKQ